MVPFTSLKLFVIGLFTLKWLVTDKRLLKIAGFQMAVTTHCSTVMGTIMLLACLWTRASSVQILGMVALLIPRFCPLLILKIHASIRPHLSLGPRSSGSKFAGGSREGCPPWSPLFLFLQLCFLWRHMVYNTTQGGITECQSHGALSCLANVLEENRKHCQIGEDPAVS